MSADGGQPDYASAFPVYRAAGWTGTLPLKPGTKFPPPVGYTGGTGLYPSGADCHAWGEHEYRGTPQLALRMPPTVVGIDVDHYADKRGLDTMREAVRRWGPMTPDSDRRIFSSSREGGSGIYFVRIPEGVVLRDRIEFPPPDEDSEPLGSVELIQRHHRYGAVWPSLHPKTGQLYVWHGTDGPDVPPRVDELPGLSPRWIEALQSERPEVARMASQAVREFFESFEPGQPCKAVLDRLNVLFGHAAGTNRHDDVRDDVLRLMRLGEQGHRGVNGALEEARKRFVFAVGPDRAGGTDEAEREFDRFLADSRGHSRGVDLILATPTPPEDRGCCGDGLDVDLPAVGTLGEAAEGPSGGSGPALDPFLLPPEVWKFSNGLQHIYRAAMARLVSPDALLHAVLAIVASLVHHRSTVDTGKSPASLSYYFAAVGRSGAGKSEALRVGRALLEGWMADRFAITGGGGYMDGPLGSGEGLIEAFMGEQVRTMRNPETGEPVLNKDGSEKTEKIRAQVRHNALFHTDEGRQVLAIDSRKGSTVTSVLCEMWTGSTAGQTNADKERTRSIKADSYVVGLMLGFQVNTVDALFADEAGGTPQRFAFAAAEYAPHGDNLDEDEDPPWPGELALDIPVSPVTVRLSDEQRREVRRNVRLKAAGKADDGPLDGHRMLLRCKVAALLALLHGQTEVDEETWELSQVIVDRSCALRDWLAGRAEREAKALAAAREAGQIRTAVRAAEKVEDVKRIRRAADRIVAAVEKAGGELAQGKALHAIRANDRDIAPSALALAISSGRVVQERREGSRNGGPRTVDVLRIVGFDDEEE